MTSSFILALTLVFAGAGAVAAEGPRARAAYNIQDAKTYAGGTTNLGLGYVTPSRWNLGVNADLLSRSYKGGSTIRDDQFGASVSHPVTAHSYLDATFTAASTANIYAPLVGAGRPALRGGRHRFWRRGKVRRVQIESGGRVEPFGLSFTLRTVWPSARAST